MCRAVTGPLKCPVDWPAMHATTHAPRSCCLAARRPASQQLLEGQASHPLIGAYMRALACLAAIAGTTCTAAALPQPSTPRGPASLGADLTAALRVGGAPAGADEIGHGLYWVVVE